MSSTNSVPKGNKNSNVVGGSAIPRSQSHTRQKSSTPTGGDISFHSAIASHTQSQHKDRPAKRRFLSSNDLEKIKNQIVELPSSAVVVPPIKIQTPKTPKSPQPPSHQLYYEEQLTSADEKTPPSMPTNVAYQHHKRSQSDIMNTKLPKQKHLYKTVLCRLYMDTGECKFGDRCHYAHGVHELRPIQKHPKYKTERCRLFHDQGVCPYGKDCSFVHNETDQEIEVALEEYQQRQLQQQSESEMFMVTPTAPTMSGTPLILAPLTTGRLIKTSSETVKSITSPWDTPLFLGFSGNGDFGNRTPQSANSSSNTGSSRSESLSPDAARRTTNLPIIDNRRNEKGRLLSKPLSSPLNGIAGDAPSPASASSAVPNTTTTNLTLPQEVDPEFNARLFATSSSTGTSPAAGNPSTNLAGSAKFKAITRPNSVNAFGTHANASTSTVPSSVNTSSSVIGSSQTNASGGNGGNGKRPIASDNHRRSLSENLDQFRIFGLGNIHSGSNDPWDPK